MWDKKTEEHLISHLTFPVKGSEILSECMNMSDLPEKDARMIEKMVNPNKTYQSLDELKADLMKSGPAEMV